LFDVAKSIEHADAPPSADCVRGTNYPSAIMCNRIPGYATSLLLPKTHIYPVVTLTKA